VKEKAIKPTIKIESRIPIVSFFTGLGLLDLGFHQAGFQSVWHNEFDSHFIKGFEYGMSSIGVTGPSSRIQNHHSITDIGPNQVLKEAFSDSGKPNLFGLIGGPPCPDFSVGGKNLGGKGERGKLSQVYVSRIVEIQPTFFLFENVPGLLRTVKHRAFLGELLGQLTQDYILDLRVLNALDYGVPQDRERMFLVGLNKSWLKKNRSTLTQKLSVEELILHARKPIPQGNSQEAEKHWLPWNKYRKYYNAKATYLWPGTSEFGGEATKPIGLPIELMVGPLICDQSKLSKLPNGTEHFKPYSLRFKTVDEGDVSKKCFKRLHRWRYSPAAAYGNNEVHLHPTEPRRLSVREAMMIQTVPPEFALPPGMTLSSKFKTIGNAVPVKLAEAVALSIKAVLEETITGNKHAEI
jgi:DNA (cytosine-5)-methyltransferase 1